MRCKECEYCTYHYDVTDEILKELEETYGDVDRIIAEIVEIYGIAVICRKHKVIRVSDDLDCLDELQES